MILSNRCQYLHHKLNQMPHIAVVVEAVEVTPLTRQLQRNGLSGGQVCRYLVGSGR